MLHKILLFTLKDDAQAALVREKMYELLAQIPGTINVAFRTAVNPEPARFKYLITVDFESMADHETYFHHDKHMAFSKKFFRPYIEDLLIEFFE